jgi:hypothetical protein
MKHKHAELIKSWADGSKIEQRDEYDMGGFCDWFFTTKPNWYSKSSEFRLRQYPKPDVVRYIYISNPNMKGINLTSVSCKVDNVKFTFDGETGELKHAEVIK